MIDSTSKVGGKSSVKSRNSTNKPQVSISEDKNKRTTKIAATPAEIKLRQQAVIRAERMALLKQRLAERNEKLTQQRKDHREKLEELANSQRNKLSDIQKTHSLKADQLKKAYDVKFKALEKQMNNLKKEIEVHKTSDIGNTLEQLNINRKVLLNRTKRISSLEERLFTLQNFIECQQTKDQNWYAPEWLILKLFAEGYHTHGRFRYLEMISESDWQGLLSFFQSKDNGFDALETLRPVFTPWIQYYHALIDVIHDRGFTIRPVEDYIDYGLQEKSVYLYHDVHAWDLMPALGMALANKDRGVRTTFCLNIDQAFVDIAHEPGYRIFGTLFGKNVALGLHCNPMATWVRMDIFNGDEDSFMEWMQSGDALNNLRSLLTNKKATLGVFKGHSKKSAKAGCLSRLEMNFEKLKSFCPEARTANHHGDILNSLYSSIGREIMDKNDFVGVPTILRNKKIKKFGIEISPTTIRTNHNPKINIYAETPNKTKYYENLHKTLEAGDTIQLINHPGAISNDAMNLNLDFVRQLDVKEFENHLAPKKPKAVNKKILSSMKALDTMDES